MRLIRAQKWALAALVGAVGVTLGVAAPAQAHARLLSAVPAAGSNVATAPDEVRLTFDGPPFEYGLGVVVTGPGGEHLETGRVNVDGNAVVQPLKALTVPGTYTVAWRVVSADGHPVSGQYSFAFEPDGSTVAASSAPGSASGSDGGAHGWILLSLAGLGVLGLALLLILPGRRRRTRGGRSAGPVS